MTKTSIYKPGDYVRVLLEQGIAEGIVDIRCGMREQGDWFVRLAGGEMVIVFHSQMELKQDHKS